MRDYLSPAKRVLTRVVPYPAAIQAIIMRHRAFVFIIVVTFVVIMTLGYITVHAVTSPQSTAPVVEQKGKTSSTVSTTTNSPSQPSSTTSSSSSTTQSTVSQSPSSSSQTNTSVTVNNEPIDVPKNGTVQRTVSNGNGTTNVTVTNNSDSNGNNNTSSYVTSNSTNSSTSSVITQDATVQSP